MRDVIVIGAGGGGPVVATELARRGLDVLVLEAGPHFDRAAEQWRHFEDDAGNSVTGYLRWGPSQRERPPWARELPQNSVVLQVAGVGGTTLHYFANSPRAYPGTFRGYARADRAAYDTAHRFPFPYRELVPYYEWVEHTLPVQTAPMGTKEELFLRAGQRLGLPTIRAKDVVRAGIRPQENAILQPRGTAGRSASRRRLEFPRAQGCTFCGHCAQGCVHPHGAPRNLRAKRSTDCSYVPMALTADAWAPGGRAVDLIADAFVTRIGTSREGGRTAARTVTWRDGRSGESHTEEASVVVLAAGAVESPRLWLGSGLPNPNDWVGRGFTDHYFDWITGVMPYETRSSHGPASAARIDFPGFGALQSVGLPPALQAFSSTLSDAGINDAGNLNGHAPTPGVDGNSRRVGGALRELLADIDRLLNVFVMTDDDVEPDNRVMLSSAFPPDDHGPLPRIELRYRERSERTARNREYLARQAVELLRRAGATRIYRFNWPPVGLHLHSTLRMGDDPADSIVDEGGEARFVARLFVADNSALPNSLGGPNPTLTTQALATRTAESILTRYFGGHPFVSDEEPVRSTDRRVTRAVLERGL